MGRRHEPIGRSDAGLLGMVGLIVIIGTLTVAGFVWAEYRRLTSCGSGEVAVEFSDGEVVCTSVPAPETGSEPGEFKNG